MIHPLRKLDIDDVVKLADYSKGVPQLGIKIKNLMVQWEDDPCWDIEETDGFEAYREGLKVYRLSKEQQWQTEYQAKLEAKAIQIGAPGNLTAAEYVLELERRIEKLENR